MTDLRAAFEVRTGGLTTLERIEAATGLEAAAVFCADGLAALVAERHDAVVNGLPADAQREGALFVNGRCARPIGDAERLAPGEALVERGTGQVVAARLAPAEARLLAGSWGLPKGVRAREVEPALLHRPADVMRFRDAALEFDLALEASGESHDAARDVVVIGDGDLSIDPTARVYPTVVLDVERGPIVIGPDAVVRPGAIVCGPAWIGAGSTVVDRAHIKAHTAIGPVCKVGGEVGGTIFQGFTNKSHDGHLGDSWVGEWVNFGAGTTNSNLLNTYGEVEMSVAPGEPRERTGLTFLGCIVGDHVKFAIGTRIMTGSVFGTGAMIATTAAPPLTVERFAWMTDAGTQRFRLDKFVEVMRAVMGRREVEASGGYLERIGALHAMGAAVGAGRGAP